MLFAVNYSPQAEALIQAGSMDIDVWKCPDWPDLIEVALAHRPVYVHFDLKAGADTVERVDWDRIAALLAQTHTPDVNLHMVPSERDAQSGQLFSAAEMAERMLGDARRATERFGPERVIIENSPFPVWEGHGSGIAVEPQVIRRVIYESGCGFLLDLSHARLAARHLGMDEREYISLLPVDRLREVHVTGIARVGQGLCDHMPMTDEDWPMFEWALLHIRSGQWAEPKVIAFEYGGVGPLFEWRSDATVLSAQVPRLNRLMKNGHRA